jgi:hypothetical protein
MPYLNPAFQGLDKFGRNFKNSPIKTSIKSIASITLPTLVFNQINKDNPNYQALDNRTKDNNYLIPMGDKFFKVPKTYQNGAIFGSLFERLQRLQSGDKDAFKGFPTTLATNFSPVQNINPLANTVVAPALYNIPKNKDFANRTIEPMGLQSRSPELRYDEKTSELGKMLSKVITPMTGLSPIQIDYLIDSYTGVIGDFVLPATTKTGSGIVEPVLRKFTADPLYNNQSVQDFYDNKKNIEQLANDKNVLKKIPSKVVTPEEKFKGILNKQGTQISDLNKKITQIQISKNMSDAEKEIMIKSLRAQIINNANKANELYKNSKYSK